MFKRDIQSKLEMWKKSPRRKPLLLRGARQVGKTTVVNEFGKSYNNYLYFNLERAAHKSLLENDLPLDTLVEQLFLFHRHPRQEGSTLIFID